MSCHVLVVEDEPSIAENIEYSLQTDGFEVTVAETGSDGLAMFRLHAPGFIIHPGIFWGEIILPRRAGSQLVHATCDSWWYLTQLASSTRPTAPSVEPTCEQQAHSLPRPKPIGAT